MLIEARLFDAAIGDFPEHLDPLLKRIFQARGIVDSAALDRQLSCLPQPAKMQGAAENNEDAGCRRSINM